MKEQEESASELVPLAEAGKTTDGGQDGDEALIQWVGHGSGHSNENGGVVSTFTQEWSVYLLRNCVWVLHGGVICEAVIDICRKMKPSSEKVRVERELGG